jgi:cell division protein FtsB
MAIGMLKNRIHILRSKTVLVFEVLIVLFLAFSVTKEIVRRKDVQSEIGRLDQQIGQLEQQNIRLADVLKEMTTDNYAEKEARRKLDLQKPGETVILLPQADQNQLLVTESANNATAEKKSTNPEKWWAFFFGNAS